MKEKIEKMLYPFAKKTKASPNLITFLSVVFTCIGFYFIIENEILTGIILFAIGGLADLLDGTVAKAQKKATMFGSLLDKFADRVNDILMIGAPIFAGFIVWQIGFATIALILLGSYLSSLLDSHTKNKKTGEGLSMRAVRIGILMLGGIAQIIFEGSAWQYAYYAIIGIALYSLIERFNYASNHV